jgi:hypothetical protein
VLWMLTIPQRRNRQRRFLSFLKLFPGEEKLFRTKLIMRQLGNMGIARKYKNFRRFHDKENIFRVQKRKLFENLKWEGNSFVLCCCD